jgi:hypothetical protein
VIKDFGEAKKEQKKVDAYNKASAKSIEAAMTLADSYEIGGAKETLSPFLEAYNDPNLSPIEKAALLDQGKAMIPNVFGRYDAKQADEIQRAQFMARGASSPRSVNLQQGEITEVIDGVQYKVPTTFNPSTGEMRRLDGSVVGAANQSANAIDAGLGFDLPTAGQTPIPEIGVYPDYGSFNEAMVLPERVDPAAIAAAAELTGEQSDVSNVSPMPMETSIPPGAVPIQAETKEPTFRPATKEELSAYGAVGGQIDESTGRFYPITLPQGMTVESDGQGGIKVVQGSGVGGKNEKAQQAKESLVDQNMQDLYFLEDRTRDMAPGVTGAVGRLISEKVFATKQAENKAIIDRISSRLTLGTLQSMRENSPTGGSLGNVSDKDIEVLRNSATSLSNTQSPEEFHRELIRLQNLQYELIHGSEDLLKKKLKSGEITQDQFDSVQANRPVKFLGGRGEVMSRDTQPSQKPSIGLTPDEMQFLESRPY